MPNLAKTGLTDIDNKFDPNKGFNFYYIYLFYFLNNFYIYY